MNASITEQHKHESAMKAVRVNGMINTKMGDHLGSTYFSVAEILVKFAKFY